MKIECSISVGVVDKKPKPYKHKRKGYWRGGKYIKQKITTKFKDVKIKDPYLGGNVELKVYSNLELGGLYEDENGRKYVCVSKNHFSEPIANLKIVSTNLGKIFTTPTHLGLIAKTNLNSHNV